jgi:hypothetical protein
LLHRAIAYWGIALSDWGNPFTPGIIDTRLLQLGRESAEGGERLGAKTERERAYLAAVSNLYRDFETTLQQARLLAYRNAMRDVAAKYPEDHEAKIFYALALASPQIQGTRPIQTSSRRGQFSRPRRRRLGARVRRQKSYMPVTTRPTLTCRRGRMRRRDK